MAAAGQLTLKAKCPLSERLKDVHVLRETVTLLHENGPRYKFHELNGAPATHAQSCVMHVLADPSSVWAGTRRFTDGGRCYCGLPPIAWNNDGTTRERPQRMVFAVYVDQFGQVYEWGWEPADNQEPGWPLEHGEARFTRGRIWPKD